MENEEDNIELKSEELQEVLGSVPPWILRWGITTLAIIIVILLAGSAFFQYPDTIQTTITLTGTTPPAGIMAKVSGKLDTLYVTDNQDVRTGDYLAIIENPAQTEDVLFLKNFLQSPAIETTGPLPPKDLNLGTIQSIYSGFYTTLFEYREFIRLQYHSNKKEFINTRIQQDELQYKNLVRQRDIIREQLDISGKQASRDSLLNKKGVLSLEEFEKSRNQYLQAYLSYENICSSLNNMQSQIMQMKESLLDNEQQFTEKGNTLRSQLNTQITQLTNEIHTWEMEYALTAPIDGKITFTNYWVKNQNISPSEDVFTIIPSDSVGLIGKALLPMASSGKVRTGQKVNIRFDNFPDSEYGIVKGIVKNISLIPSKTLDVVNYTVEVELPSGLVSSYNKELPYLPQMSGKADIITDDLSLLERLFMPLRKIWTENITNP